MNFVGIDIFFCFLLDSKGLSIKFIKWSVRGWSLDAECGVRMQLSRRGSWRGEAAAAAPDWGTFLTNPLRSFQYGADLGHKIAEPRPWPGSKQHPPACRYVVTLVRHCSCAFEGRACGNISDVGSSSEAVGEEEGGWTKGARGGRAGVWA